MTLPWVYDCFGFGGMFRFFWSLVGVSEEYSAFNSMKT
jgi:hypothetical protein